MENEEGRNGITHKSIQSGQRIETAQARASHSIV